MKVGVKARIIIKISGGSKTTSIRGGNASNSRKNPFAASTPVPINQHKKPIAVNKKIFFFWLYPRLLFVRHNISRIISGRIIKE
jgi:hypothetical protein